MGGCLSRDNIKTATTIENEKIPLLDVKATTWKRDSHGLFDYESNLVDRKTFKIIGTSRLMRDENHEIFQEQFQSSLVKQASRITQLPALSNNNPGNSHSNNNNNNNAIQRPQYETENQNANCDTYEPKPNTIVNVFYCKDRYWLYNSNSANHPLYQVAKFSKNRSTGVVGVPVQIGDVIKLGRVELVVKELHIQTEGSSQSEESQNEVRDFGHNIEVAEEENRESDRNYITDIDKNELVISQKESPKFEENDGNSSTSSLHSSMMSKKTKLDQKMCRICLSHNSTKTNPLISPCLCSGTMKYLHLDCLRMWLHNKGCIKTNDVSVVYNFKSFQCELCKSFYPKTFHVKNKNYEIIKINRPDSGNYLILESIAHNINNSNTNNTQAQNNTYVYVCKFDNTNKILLGRGHESDVRITDISVSRTHSILKFTGNEFVIEDSNSKFGTLIKLVKPISIPPFNSRVIQSGRTMVSFQLKRKCALFNSCFQASATETSLKTEELLKIQSSFEKKLINKFSHMANFDNCQEEVEHLGTPPKSSGRDEMRSDFNNRGSSVDHPFDENEPPRTHPQLSVIPRESIQSLIENKSLQNLEEEKIQNKSLSNSCSLRQSGVLPNAINDSQNNSKESSVRNSKKSPKLNIISSNEQSKFFEDLNRKENSNHKSPKCLSDQYSSAAFQNKQQEFESHQDLKQTQINDIDNPSIVKNEFATNEVIVEEVKDEIIEKDIQGDNYLMQQTQTITSPQRIMEETSFDHGNNLNRIPDENNA